jgi:hypothetical protein
MDFVVYIVLVQWMHSLYMLRFLLTQNYCNAVKDRVVIY